MDDDDDVGQINFRFGCQKFLAMGKFTKKAKNMFCTVSNFSEEEERKEERKEQRKEERKVLTTNVKYSNVAGSGFGTVV